MVTALIAGLLLVPVDSLASERTTGERTATKTLAAVSPNDDFSAWQVSGRNQQASLGQLGKWSDLLSRHEGSAQADTLCIEGLEAVCAAYGAGGLASLDQGGMTKAVRQINNAVNRLTFMKDQIAFKKSDHWATPAEFAALGGGDCEDFAIYKYFLLREMGVPAENMRMVILRIKGSRLYHAVLAVDIGDATYVLDKNIPTMVRADTLRLYNPIYSFNEAAWWRHA